MGRSVLATGTNAHQLSPSLCYASRVGTSALCFELSRVSPSSHCVCASRVQADQLLASLDKDGDGLLDYVEFLSAFKVVDMKKGSSSDAVTMLSASPPSTSGPTPKATV